MSAHLSCEHRRLQATAASRCPGCRPQARRALAEYRRHPRARRCWRRWCCSASSSRLFGNNPLDLYVYMYQGAFGTWFSWQNTLHPRRAADADRAVHGDAGAARHGDHRRRRRAVDRRALRRRRPALALPAAPPLSSISPWRSPAWPAAAVDHAGRRAAPVPRRQRDDFEPAARLHRASRFSIIWSRGRCAIPPASTSRRRRADRRRQHDRQHSRHRRALGAWRSASSPRSLAYILIYHTVFGFAARMAGGNIRAAKVVGLPRRQAHPHHLLSGRGCGRPRRHGRSRRGAGPRQCQPGGRLRLHRHSGGVPRARTTRSAIIPVAVLLGGIGASGGLLQRRLGLPDASVLVLQGMIFVVVLASDSLYGRSRFLQGSLSRGRTGDIGLWRRAARGARRRGARQHAVSVRQPRRVHHRAERAASISASKARW